MFNNFLLGATNFLLAASDGADFSSFADSISGLIESMFKPLIGIFGALTCVWGIYLGLKFWKSDDEKKREEAKKALLSFAIGVVVIFVVAVAAPLLIMALSDWMQTQQVM